MQLWGHQERAVSRNIGRDYFALFFEMGTGKTRTAIEILKQKTSNHQSNRQLKVLILCPLVVCPNWTRELKQWGDISAVFLNGSQKSRIQSFQKSLGLGISAYVLNYEGLLMKDLFCRLSMWGPEFLIFDESHKLKSPNSQRTKRSYELSLKARYRYLLTGSPTPNDSMDLFSQFLVLDHGKAFGNNYFAFRHRYFYDANAKMPAHIHFPNWKIKPDSQEKMAMVLREHSMSVTKEECLDLPPLVKERRYVEMGKEQQRLYNEMKKDFVTYLKDKAVVAQLALTKALRLQQIVSGYIKDVDGNELEIDDSKRLDALMELIEDSPSKKIIIWAVFKQNFRSIAERLKKGNITFVEVHGEISQKEKQANIDAFINDPRCRVYLGHPGSGGIGVNLTVSDLCIYYSRDFSLEHDLQSEARNHRGGSEIHSKITRIDLVCADTIDELVLERLDKKQQMGEKLLEGIRQSWM